ncbi:MAG: glycosyltransferase family 1 protein [Anaerolineae bacterium]|nr:MAG: glycosyltransferase family 1 protein [Anaerolineae bacterium]
MDDRLHLVMVEPNGSGGLIHYAYQLCTALAEEGVDVTLVTGREYELADLPHNFTVNNVLDLWPLFEAGRSEEIRLGRWRRLWRKVFRTLRRGVRAVRLIRAWLLLVRYLLRLHPDVVLFSKINFPFEAFFLAYLRRRGLFLSQICHEFELRESRWGALESLVARLYASVYPNFSALFFHAKENRQRFLALYPRISPERMFLIPHGNSEWLLRLPMSVTPDELRERYGLSVDDRVVLFFGLLAPSKGLEDLLDAFALARRDCDAKLVIAGYPTKHMDMVALQERIDTLGLRKDVILDTRYIPLDEVGALMGLASVVVYPYRSGTQSGALQVAYIFGRPVVVTRVGGLPEAVEDGKSGFLVPPRSPEALADRIVTLVNDPALAKRMGDYARHLAETRFSWQTVARKILDVYDSLLSRAR